MPDFIFCAAPYIGARQLLYKILEYMLIKEKLSLVMEAERAKSRNLDFMRIAPAEPCLPVEELDNASRQIIKQQGESGTRDNANTEYGDIEAADLIDCLYGKENASSPVFNADRKVSLTAGHAFDKVLPDDPAGCQTMLPAERVPCMMAELVDEPQSIVTRVDIGELVSKLDAAEADLSKASYKIGYLEAELNDREQHVKLLSNIKSQAWRLAQIEKEHKELLLRLARLEHCPRNLWSRIIALFGRPAGSRGSGTATRVAGSFGSGKVQNRTD